MHACTQQANSKAPVHVVCCPAVEGQQPGPGGHVQHRLGGAPFGKTLRYGAQLELNTVSQGILCCLPCTSAAQALGNSAWVSVPIDSTWPSGVTGIRRACRSLLLVGCSKSGL